MSVKVSKTRKKDWKEVQRRRRFRQYYLDTSDAVQSALAAGYTQMTANTHAFRMAAACEETLRDQCDLLGLNHMALVLCLKRNLTAKEPRWNQKHERWDLFENPTAQIAAYDRLKDIIEPEVPKPQNSTKVGVAISAGAASQTAWLEQYGAKAQAGAAITVTVEQSTGDHPGNGGNGHRSVRPEVETTGRPTDGGDNGEVDH